jgi:hypothetical protein
MEVPTLEQHLEIVSRYELLARKVELMAVALTFNGWVHHREAQRILGVAKLDTLKEWRDKGHLEMREKSDRIYEVSTMSIASRLLAKGYTLETVAQRLAA